VDGTCLVYTDVWNGERQRGINRMRRRRGTINGGKMKENTVNEEEAIEKKVKDKRRKKRGKCKGSWKIRGRMKGMRRRNRTRSRNRMQVG
jgi:hypothetical protein